MQIHEICRDCPVAVASAARVLHAELWFAACNLSSRATFVIGLTEPFIAIWSPSDWLQAVELPSLRRSVVCPGGVIDGVRCRGSKPQKARCRELSQRPMRFSIWPRRPTISSSFGIAIRICQLCVRYMHVLRVVMHRHQQCLYKSCASTKNV